MAILIRLSAFIVLVLVGLVLRRQVTVSFELTEILGINSRLFTNYFFDNHISNEKLLSKITCSKISKSTYARRACTLLKVKATNAKTGSCPLAGLPARSYFCIR